MLEKGIGNKETLMDILWQALIEYLRHFDANADLGLIMEAAESHGIGWSQGGVFKQPVENQYSYRGPIETDQLLSKIQSLKSITVACMDRRQVKKVADKLSPNQGQLQDALLASAGGAVQFNEQRLNALAQLLAACVKVNPSLRLNLAYHTGVCGGANYFHANRGHFARMYDKKDGSAPAQEAQEMLAQALMLKKKLIKLGVPASNIELYQANIEDDKCGQIQRLNT